MNASNDKPVMLQLGRGNPKRSRKVKIYKARWPVCTIEADAVGGVGIRADIFEGRMIFGAPHLRDACREFPIGKSERSPAFLEAITEPANGAPMSVIRVTATATPPAR